MNRGSPDFAPRGSCAAHGFNEAPIHESGKSALPWGARHGCSRFNEAPIHESGKSGISRVSISNVAWLQ